jgi:hypothetical protein
LLNSSPPSSSSSSYSLSAKEKNDIASSQYNENGNLNTCNGQINQTENPKPNYIQPPLQTIKFECTCNAPRLAPEFEFTKALIHIGKKLIRLSSKELKSNKSN